MVIKISLFVLGLLASIGLHAQSGQISVPRIDKMPDQPSPYLMRDWKQVAMKYDSFIYDVSKTGQYLPLGFIENKGKNYPSSEAFRLHTFVGTHSPLGNEAINVLPSLVGATLGGINKSAQFGKNWVEMSQDFFNLSNAEGIYLNNPLASSGQDWWYDVMPNVFFYQLYDLYDGIGPVAKVQFTQVADKFTASVVSMGGSSTPWKLPYMNYRGWKFATMQPNATGVPEPEAAGAYAWILYNAFLESGKGDYLKAAEWSMEFLNTWNANPSYELQLPYGVYTAARMNAELGTKYNVEKMVNWCFDRGNLRGWGAIVGNWGGLQVSGLIGEANDNGNDYAFQMNGLQQAACLVPMVRYDKRFATAIGKWVLNLANATRLFYPGFLPESKQDAAAWSGLYDKDQVVGYEALRQVWQGQSPFSTGDAKKSGWAATNLALYGTSSIGYLGGIVEQTNVAQILKLDMLKTDFFKDSAYPTYLYYNPYSVQKIVTAQVSSNTSDVYEMLSEQFTHRGVQGQIEIVIPPKQSVVVVFCPENGQIRYEKNIMLVNNIPVDYGQNQKYFAIPPRIKALAAEQNPVELGKSVRLFCTAEDGDSPQLSYQWTSQSGTFEEEGSTVIFQYNGQPGEVTIYCKVQDSDGSEAIDSLVMNWVPRINKKPIISGISSSRIYVAPNETIALSCEAYDPDGDRLTYTWKPEAGSIQGTGSNVLWVAPSNEGIYTIEVRAEDSLDASATFKSSWLIYNFDSISAPSIAYYPFQANTLDQSGNQLHASPKGVVLTADRKGKVLDAYYFNGGSQSIQAGPYEKLNVETAISLVTWVKPLGLPDRETFILSHGSWQNRWKLSITPDRLLRWTINTTGGIADLDSRVAMESEKYYHIVATYDGEIMSLFINGQLQSFRRMTGKIRKTAFPLLMGQMLPDNTTYNFKGVLDEVTIFNYALTPTQVRQSYEGILSSLEEISESEPSSPVRWKIVSNQLWIEDAGGENTPVQVQVVAIDGRIVFSESLSKGEVMIKQLDFLNPGIYTLQIWDGAKVWATRFLKI